MHKTDYSRQISTSSVFKIWLCSGGNFLETHRLTNNFGESFQIFMCMVIALRRPNIQKNTLTSPGTVGQQFISRQLIPNCRNNLWGKSMSCMTRVPFKLYLQRYSLSFFKEKLTFIRQPAPASDPCLLRLGARPHTFSSSFRTSLVLLQFSYGANYKMYHGTHLKWLTTHLHTSALKN